MAVKKKSVDVLAEAARDLRPKEIGRLTFEVLSAKGACRDGLAKLKPHRALLARRYPGFDLSELDSLPELCDRTAAAQRIVQRAAGGPSATELLPAAQGWRRKLLPLAQALAEAGALDRKAVARIISGAGVPDQLQDVIDLVSLLSPQRSKIEAVHGAGALGDADQAAKKAIAALGKGTATSEEAGQAAELRDRYATLVVRRHDRLRAALAAVAGYRDADKLAPPLNDGRQTKKVTVPPAEVAPG